MELQRSSIEGRRNARGNSIKPRLGFNGIFSIITQDAPRSAATLGFGI
jgi:hypothetical protein